MKKMNVSKFFLATLLGGVVQATQAMEFVPDRSNPFAEDNFKADKYYDKSIVDEGDVRTLPAGSSAVQFNKLINQMNDDGIAGGVIRLENSSADIDYTFKSIIHLISNIRVEIARNTVIKVEKTPLLFSIGAQSRDVTLKNVSITNFGDGRPTFDLSAYNKNKSVRLIKLGNVKNFYVGDFDVEDNYSVHSVISLNPPAKKTDKLKVWRRGPKDGVIANISQTKAHAGYGVTQTQTAENVLFLNLHNTGGIALRLETGSNLSNEISASAAIIDGLWAKNISVTNGHSAVLLSPHGKFNKDVFIDTVTAQDSAYGVLAGRGFVNTEKVGDRTTGPVPKLTNGKATVCNIDSRTLGTFENARIRNVTVNRGNRVVEAQIKAKEFDTYEKMNDEFDTSEKVNDDFEKWENMERYSDGVSRKGQAINAVKMTSAKSASEIGQRSKGFWAFRNERGSRLTDANISRRGFKSSEAKIYYRDDIGQGEQNFKNCIINVVTNTSRFVDNS